MSIDPQEASSLIQKLEAIIADPDAILSLKDDTIRRRLREAGRKVSIAMESAGDATHRIANTVRN